MLEIPNGIPDYSKIKGVKVYLERYTRRIPVGELKQENNKYVFTYYRSYLYYKYAIPVGVELPLTKQYFESVTIFEAFWDRIPSKKNSAYPEYCNLFKISPEENNILVLLVTIGRKGPSSFIFEPIWDEFYIKQDIKAFRKNLDLSTREFAAAFSVTQSTIVRLENDKSRGSDILKFLEILSKFPDAAIYYIEKYGNGLHSKTKDKLLKKLFSLKI